MDGLDWQGPAWAGTYDKHFPALEPDDPMLALLSDLFPESSVLLEFGVGTGRVALPLADLGRDVVGVDISPDMLAVLRSKDNGRLQQIVEGSFTDISLGREFDGVYAVFNTLGAVLSASDQLEAIKCAMAHTRPGGRVVIENSNPVLTTRGYEYGQLWVVKELSRQGMHVMAGRHDAGAQYIRLRHMFFGEGGIQTLPADVRYIWPSELQLMGRLAGFEVEATYGDWDRSTYSSESPCFIVVFRNPGR